MGILSMLVISLFVYAIFAMFRIYTVRAQAKKTVLVEYTQVDPAFLEKVRRGSSGSQMFAFILHLILAIILLCGLLTMLGGFLPNLTGSNSDNWFLSGSGILWALALLFPLTPTTIVADIFWGFRQKVAIAEAYVLVAKTASGLVRFQRVLGWVIWGSYTAFLAYIIFAVMQIIPVTY